MAIVDRRLGVTDGIAVKAPCRVATTANLTLSGLQTIDGIPLAENDRVLVKDQSTGCENGIYQASSGNWSRSRDFDGAFDVVTGTRLFVIAGSTNGGYEFQISTTGEIAIGTTALAFAAMGQASAAASAAAAAASALAGAGSASDAQDAATAAASVLAQVLGLISTGDIKPTLKTVADPGWVMCNDGTIGDGSSGATSRANADTANLYALLWNSVANNYAPVTGGRGASAAADFAAHKPLALTRMLGRVLSASGSGSGLTSRALGEVLGAETHQLVDAELPSHYHDVFLHDPGHAHNTFQVGLVGFGSSGFANSTGGFTNPNTSTNATGVTVRDAAGGAGTANRTATKGSGLPHNNMQPTSFVNFMIKL